MVHPASFRDTVRVLGASSIRRLVPMNRAIRLMEDAFKILSAGEAFIPHRVVVTDPESSMSVFFKPAFPGQYQRMSIKILTQIRDNRDPHDPTIKGLVLLIDNVTGKILSIADGRSLTAIRTGAASGVATDYLARSDARSVAIFGCGAQGYTQLEAVMAVRPVNRVLLFDISASRAASLADRARFGNTISWEANPDIQALRDIDIICTATPAVKPLFSPDHVKPGVHINAVGSYRPDMQEIDPEIISKGRIYLDDAPACLAGSGDLMIPIASGLISESKITGELGDLIAGNVDGRQDAGEITVFKSVGNAIQDFFIANEAYEKSLDQSDIHLIDLDG